ncbi:MAG: hypothetical protein CO108_20680, partial [Deltaproteobacteria bacterium CG_4_9_14_3_um_filter_63_12]
GRVALREGDGSQDDAIGGDGNSDVGTNNNDFTSGGDTTNNGGDSTTTGNDTNTTSNDTSTSGCTNGIIRCSLAGNIETCRNGFFVETLACAAGCQASTCIDAPLSGRCNAPVTITLGQTVVSTTDTGDNPNTWLQECTGGGDAPTGPETVFEINMPMPMMVKITLDSVDSTYFALYLRGVCDDMATQLHSTCAANSSPGGSIELTTLLGKGQHFIFVDSFNYDQFGPGRFKLKVQEALMPPCGDHIPQILDVSNGPAVVQGDTAMGASSELWMQQHCPNDAFQSRGKERAYAFALRNFSNVSINGQPTNPADSMMGVYVRTICDDSFSQVYDEANHFAGCGYTDGGVPATINWQYRPGAYYVFVDDFLTSAGDGPQQFTLTVNAP